MNELDIAIIEFREKIVELVNESRLPVTVTSMIMNEVNTALQQNYQQVFNTFLQAKKAQELAAQESLNDETVIESAE